MTEIEIEGFIFTFSDLKNPSSPKAEIECQAKSLGKYWIGKEQESHAQEVVNDIGKWETLMKFATDLGLIEGQASNKFQYTKYNPVPQYRDNNKDKGVVGFTFALEYEEIRRRASEENRNESDVELTKDEITKQMENTPKWRNLKFALGFLKTAYLSEK